MISPPDDRDTPQTASLAEELRVLIGKLNRRLREQAHIGDLTWSQLLVITRLEREGPATVTTLAKAQGMRPQSMGANIAVLEAAGLVGGIPNPNDRRQTILSLTQACRDLLKTGRGGARGLVVARHPNHAYARRTGGIGARGHLAQAYRRRLTRRRLHARINRKTSLCRQRHSPPKPRSARAH